MGNSPNGARNTRDDIGGPVIFDPEENLDSNPVSPVGLGTGRRSLAVRLSSATRASDCAGALEPLPRIPIIESGSET